MPGFPRARYMAFDISAPFNGKYVMQMFVPKLVRSKCGVCSEHFGNEPVMEHEGGIVHVKCVVKPY